MRKVITIAAMALLTGSFAQAKVNGKVSKKSIKTSKERAGQNSMKEKVHGEIKAKDEPKKKTVK